MSEPQPRINNKQWLLIILGTILGIVFLYITFRDVSWGEFAQGLGELNPIYLIPAAIILICIQIVRALRFGAILKPISRMGLLDLWNLVNIWGALNVMMPARLAEFARPYLLKRRGVPFSSVFGAVMVERFFDLSGLLLLLAICLSRTPQIPPEYTNLGKLMFICLAGGYFVVFLALAKRDFVEKILMKILSWLPERPAGFLGAIMVKLLDGLSVMSNIPRALLIFCYSVAIWLLFSLMTYLFLRAFGIEAPFLVAVTIQVFVCLGVALPSAPGFVGTFHVAVRYGLALFGVQAALSVPLATVFHLFNVLLSIALGIISYWIGDYKITAGALLRDETPRVVGDQALLPDGG